MVKIINLFVLKQKTGRIIRQAAGIRDQGSGIRDQAAGVKKKEISLSCCLF